VTGCRLTAKCQGRPARGGYRGNADKAGYSALLLLARLEHGFLSDFFSVIVYLLSSLNMIAVIEHLDSGV
jgi:hypothetical protein